MDLYETDDNGDFVYIEKDDELFPIKIDITIENIITNGLTTDILLKICEYLKVPLNIFQYATNYLEDRLFKQSINSSKSKSKGLNLVVENNHVYLIEEINSIHRFNGIIQHTNSIFNRRQPKKKDEIKTTIIANTEELTPYMFLKSASRLPTRITLNDGAFNSFTITKGTGKSKSRTKYIVNPDLDIMNYYGDTYEGQSAQSIGIQYLEDLPQSNMTNEVFEALNKPKVKHRTHSGILYPEYFDKGGLPNSANIEKYDLNKAHAYVMNYMKYIYVLDITQQITQTRTLDGDGVYFVETHDDTLLHGTNWYSFEMLEKALEIGGYFKVKYKLNVKKIINPYPKYLND
jgi:hypothetical protein